MALRACLAETNKMLSLQTFDSMEVRLDGKPLKLPASRKTRALLAYLVLSGVSQRRDRLCELLWGIRDDSRGALRWSLCKLRPILNAGGRERLLADRDRVQIDAQAIAVDFHVARACVTDDRASTADLARAWEQTRLPLMQDCELPGQPAFTAWLEEQRLEVQKLRVQLAQRLALSSEVSAEEAELWTQRWVSDAQDISRVGRESGAASNDDGNTAPHAGAGATHRPAQGARVRDWLELEGRLRRALRDGALKLAYQPKFRTHDHELVGVEALLRWNDVEYGDVSPARFVPIAEGSGLIVEIGMWVMRTACRQLRRWLDRGIRIPVAINCSAKELLHADPARVLEAAAAAAGVPTSLIEIELTESMLIDDSPAVQATLRRFRQLGCRIALDDFGTGYSSLAYITRFPPDRIKIDKMFVRSVDSSPGDAAVANAILSLAASLNLVVTAEGVERQEQLEWLRSRGCHEIQGSLLSAPLFAAELEAQFFSADTAAEPAPTLMAS
jgi:EAL domain-containing protein (putative c-di-GMP-specific phosphodiesterase class I)